MATLSTDGVGFSQSECCLRLDSRRWMGSMSCSGLVWDECRGWSGGAFVKDVRCGHGTVILMLRPGVGMLLIAGLIVAVL